MDDIRSVLLELRNTTIQNKGILHRINLLQKALSMLPKTGNEKMWGMLQLELADCLLISTAGDRERNRTRAIQAYHQAVTVITKERMPERWANAMTNLGSAYVESKQGIEQENIQQAINYYENALTVFTEKLYPQDWARLKYNLGIALSKNAEGDKSANIELAITAFRQALSIINRRTSERQWADILNSLATRYTERLEGIKSENIEEAIKLLEQALSVRTRSVMPLAWAQSVVNLAAAYNQRELIDKPDAIEQIISLCSEALNELSTAASPDDRIAALQLLGSAFHQRWLGDRSNNIERSIYFLEHALAETPVEAKPVKWAYLKNLLGNVYADRISGNRAENLDKALSLYQEALKVRTPTRTPEEWAETLNNIGTVYSSRIYGDRADNLEMSIDAYIHALTVRTQNQMPVEWAQTLHNLGVSYSERVRGIRNTNIDLAIDSYRKALVIRTREAMPYEWSGTVANLANLYVRQSDINQEFLDFAIDAYKHVLTVRTYEKMPYEWATTMFNLASAYAQNKNKNYEANLEQAIKAYEQALIVRTQEEFPYEWAQTIVNLANAFGDRISGVRDDNVKRAEFYYQQALTIYTSELFPLEHQHLLTNLHLLYLDEHMWNKAYHTGLKAISVGKRNFYAAYIDAGRESTINEIARLYLETSYCALRLGLYSESIEHIEAGKARLISEVLSITETNLTHLDNRDRDKIANLREMIRALEYEYRQEADSPTRRPERIIVEDLRNARLNLNNSIQQIKQQHAEILPDGLDIVQILNSIPENTALVMPLVSSKGTFVFVIPHGVSTVTDEYLIQLDDFTISDLHDISRGNINKPGWLQYYINYRFDNTERTLLHGIDTITKHLWTKIVNYIYDKLKSLKVDGILLIPQGDLSLLPLHAAWRIEDGQRRYFLDDFEIALTPSMFIFRSAKQRSVPGAGALVIGVTSYEQLSSLPSAQVEATSIASIFNTQPLLDIDASKSAIRSNSVGKKYLHFACHGAFSWSENPLESALYVGGNEILPLREIIATFELGSVRLVVLSACETGIVDFRGAVEQSVSLSTGFMQAGAEAVISALWIVDDQSTQLLMERFYYYHLKEHIEPRKALQMAQCWLRDSTTQQLGEYFKSFFVSRMNASSAYVRLTNLFMNSQPDDKPYSHPYFWAAFTYYGI